MVIKCRKRERYYTICGKLSSQKSPVQTSLMVYVQKVTFLLPEGLGRCYIAVGLVDLSPGTAFREFSHLKLSELWLPRTKSLLGALIETF